MKLDKFDPDVEIRRLSKRIKDWTPKLPIMVYKHVNNPYTFVQLMDDTYTTTATGFAKCRPNDPFNEDIGLRIATARALRSYAKVVNESVL